MRQLASKIRRLCAPISGFICARWPQGCWPQGYNSKDDKARQARRLVLAAFLTAPGTPERTPSNDQLPGTGFSQTPGIGFAVRGHRLAFTARDAEEMAVKAKEKGQLETAKGHDVKAKEDYKSAAQAFYEAAQEIPNIDDNANDTAGHYKLAKSLALMLLAYHAVKADLAERDWGDFGKAEKIAEQAIGDQPQLLYLRSQHAEILRLLKKYKQSIDVLAKARPLAPSLRGRKQLACMVVDIAASSADQSLMASAEEEFITPLIEKDPEQGQPDTPEDDADIKHSYKIILPFQAGRLDFFRADVAQPRTEESLVHARRAAQRFTHALELIPEENERDKVSVTDWRDAAAMLAGEIALSIGSAEMALEEFTKARKDKRQVLTNAIGGWIERGLPARYASAALVTKDPWAKPSLIGLRALSSASKQSIDPERVALPPIPDPIVVVVNNPLLMDKELVYQILGSKNQIRISEETYQITGLRKRLGERFGFTLPSVILRDGTDDSSPRRIAVLFRGIETTALTPPEGAELAVAHPKELAAAGRTVLHGETPVINGVPCSWVTQGTRAPGILVLNPAFALVGVLEDAVLRAMDRLTSLDDVNRALHHDGPSDKRLTEEELDQGIAVLRHLLAERMPLGVDAAKEEVVRRLKAGDDPHAVMAYLRALPGLRPLLWGNEPGRRAVVLPSGTEGAILAEPHASGSWVRDLGQLLEGLEDPVLVVSAEEQRGPVRAAIAGTFPDLPVLAESERVEAT